MLSCCKSDDYFRHGQASRPEKAKKKKKKRSTFCKRRQHFFLLSPPRVSAFAGGFARKGRTFLLKKYPDFGNRP